MSNKFLEARGLRKIYSAGQKEVRAVDGVDLSIERGKSFTITGPSGAGKSTLLHMLGGLDRPSSGSVVMEGADIYKMQDGQRAVSRNKDVGFVFQFYNLLPEFTALENVMMPALIGGTAGAGGFAAVKDKAAGLLATVGLKERTGHHPSELSGGESQRVAIARALMNGPKILLCDEPTGNLDSKNSLAVYDLLFGLSRTSGMSLVIVTHDESVSSRTDRTIRMKDGKIV